MQSPSSSTTAFASNAAIEEEYFAPLMIKTNALRRKLCAAVEKLGVTLVDIPADQILSVSAADFASAELKDESASHEECTQLMAWPRWWSSSKGFAR
jgi:hypothetical protein